MVNRLDGGPAQYGGPKIATLTYKNATIELPVYGATRGPDAIDISNLHRDTGCLAVDPGYTSTANCASCITFIDGEKGEMLYRGYPVEQLAERLDFLTVVYLLLNGELPTDPRRGRFISLHHFAPHDVARADGPLLHRVPT